MTSTTPHCYRCNGISDLKTFNVILSTLYSHANSCSQICDKCVYALIEEDYTPRVFMNVTPCEKLQKEEEEPSKEVIYNCPDCDYKFTSFARLYAHKIFNHNDSIDYSWYCDECKIGFRTTIEVSDHCDKHHLLPRVEENKD